MSRQLRVTSLLVSKKTSEVADGSPSPSVSNKAKAAWTSSVSSSPSPDTPQQSKKQKAAAMQLQEQVVPSTSPPPPESPTPTRVTRTRSSSQASPVASVPSPSADSPLPIRTQSSTTTSSTNATPLKRKNAASAVEPQAPESAKKKRVEPSLNEEAVTTESETGMVDAAEPSTSISATSVAPADAAEPTEMESDPSLSLDDPIVLPPLNPIPLTAPIISKTMSRGASLLARTNPGASLLNPRNPRALRLDPATVAQITPSTAAAIRSANASHSALMATIEALAPGSTSSSSSALPLSAAAAAAASATAARAPSLVDPTMPSLESLAQKIIATGNRIETIQPRPAVVAAAPSAASPFTVAPRYQPIVDPSHTLTELKSRTIASLPLPVRFSFLTSVFSGTDSSLSMLLLRFRSANSCSWVREIQPATQRIVGKKIDLPQLQQLISIYPDCYRLHENHTLDSMGRLTKDYKLSFGSSNGESEEEESKKRLQAVAAASALAQGEIPVVPSSASIVVGAQNANLVARRKELEHRMQVYVYEAHQAYLMNLRQTLLAIIEEEKQISASKNISAETEAKLAEIKRAKGELPSVNAFLETPFSRLPMWYPSFQLDSSTHCPSVPLFPLPDQQLKEMTKTQAATPNSLLDMARMKQPIPVKVGLESENRGNPTSTNNGASSSAAAIPSSSAAISSSSTASSSPSSSLNRKALSVLSPAVRAAMASHIESSRASMLSAGDPKERAVLRQLMALRPLYEAIKLRLKMEQNRPNIPIEELLPKLRSSSMAAGAGGASASDFSDASVVKPLLTLLATHLPHWCSIGSSGRPPVDIFRTRKTGEIDPASGRDRNVPILEALVERQQALLKQEADRFAPASSSSSTPVKVQAGPAEPAPMDTDEIKVKVEATEELTAAASSAAIAPVAASAIGSPAVKVESIASPSTLAHASAVASAVKNIAASRLASPNKAAIVAASPSKRMTNSSRAASMVAGASGAKKPAAANLLARMR